MKFTLILFFLFFFCKNTCSVLLSAAAWDPLCARPCLHIHPSPDPSLPSWPVPTAPHPPPWSPDQGPLPALSCPVRSVLPCFSGSATCPRPPHLRMIQITRPSNPGLTTRQVLGWKLDSLSSFPKPPEVATAEALFTDAQTEVPRSTLSTTGCQPLSISPERPRA